MTTSRLKVLAIVTLVAIAGAFWISSARNHSMSGAAGEALYPTLKGNAAAATRIRIYRRGDELVADMRRTQDEWQVEQRNDYPAAVSKIRTLLLDLERAHIEEQKTSNPANYPTLGVNDVSDKAATGVRVEIEGLATPLKLIIGKSDLTNHTTYVRRAGEAASLLVDVEMEIPSTTGAWLRKDIIDIGADRVQQAAVSIAGEPPYIAMKNARTDANFTVTGVPKGRELNSPAAANSIATALASLELEDVRPLSEISGEKPAAHAVFRTFDGLVLNIDGWQQGEKRYIAFASSFDNASAERFHMGASSSIDKGDASKPAATTQNNAPPDQEAKNLDARLRPWAFEVVNFKYEAIFKPIEQVLKKK